MRLADNDDEASKRRQERSRKQIETLDKAVEDARAYMTAKEPQKMGDSFSKTDVRWEAMLPVLKGELPVWIRADSLMEIESAVSWADKHNLRVVLFGGIEAHHYAGLLKRRDIPVIITSVLCLPRRRDADFDEPFTLSLRLHQAGVKFCIACGGASSIRNLPYHAAKAAAYGLPKDEALKAITLYPAQIIGVAERVGSLEKGKDATLIITDGDPLEITTHIEELFIQGRRIDLSNKYRRLYDKYRQRYRQLDVPK